MQFVDPNEDITNVVKTAKPQTEKNWWVIEGLPSKGKLYPKDTVIKGRPLTTLEVKKLATMGNQVDETFNEIISGAVTGIDLEDLLVADKLYIIFWLRANTYKDSGFSVEFNCLKCNSKSEYEFQMDNVNVLEIREDYDEDRILELPISGEKVTVKYLRVKNENVVSNFLKNSSNSLTKYDTQLLELASSIDTIDGENVPSLLNKYNFLSDIDPTDFAYLVSYLNSFEIGVDKVMTVKCGKCGGESPTGITFRPKFFIPTFKF